MSTEIQTIDVNLPIDPVYAQWTQFESFPHFMKGVEKVRQITDDVTDWTVKVGGVERTFLARITEQTPDQRIAWHAYEGLEHSGVVTFHSISDDTTRVTLQMEFEPHGIVETAGDILGFTELQTRGDLKRFKAFIEETGVPTGTWDGTIEKGAHAAPSIGDDQVVEWNRSKTA